MIPLLFCIVNCSVVVLAKSPLKKLLAGIVVSPITNASAFSAVPKYLTASEPTKGVSLKLNPALSPVLNPGIATLGINACFAIIAIIWSCILIESTLYVKSSVPTILLACVPVKSPSLNSGPTNTQPEPVNK